MKITKIWPEKRELQLENYQGYNLVRHFDIIATQKAILTCLSCGAIDGLHSVIVKVDGFVSNWTISLCSKCLAIHSNGDDKTD